jgi:hypothetical protein
MKTRVQKFRPEHRARVAVAAGVGTVLALAAACRPASLAGGEFRQHPAALVGQWTDVAKSTTTDSALWVLTADGDDLSMHLRAGNAGTPFVASEPVRHGYWYLHGRMTEPADRTICFTKRPGRSAPDCRAFDLDTVETSSARQPRLLVHGYQGEHHAGDRALLKRGA